MTSTNPELPGEQCDVDGAEQGPESSPQAAVTKAQAEPPLNSATTGDPPLFGWSAYAERVNGRFAMIGLVAVLVIEVVSRDTFLHWAGFLS